jgi:hypothetical protein
MDPRLHSGLLLEHLRDFAAEGWELVWMGGERRSRRPSSGAVPRSRLQASDRAGVKRLAPARFVRSEAVVRDRAAGTTCQRPSAGAPHSRGAVARSGEDELLALWRPASAVAAPRCAAGRCHHGARSRRRSGQCRLGGVGSERSSAPCRPATLCVGVPLRRVRQRPQPCAVAADLDLEVAQGALPRRRATAT